MTMIDNNHAPVWHSTAESVRDDEITELRRALAAAELRAMNAVQAEDVAQFAFETAKRRADVAETALRALLVEYVIEPQSGELDGISDKVDTSDVPDNVLEDIAGDLIDDLYGGLPYDELPEVARGHLQGWAEEQ